MGSLEIRDDLVCSIVKSNINSLDAKQKRGYVIEGFPNTNVQANECLQYLPSHVFILYADEEYIYEKYEEENNTNIFSNVNNLAEDEYAELFEMKEKDTNEIKDEVNVYLRNVSGVLKVLGNNKKAINLKEYNEKSLIDHIMNLVRQNENNWNSVLGDDTYDGNEYFKST
ncbi:adenylate kinase-like protein 2, putative [Plasmodium malariae]|uniref:Adenylate kinase-like protein 2, putative n=1 Tax=Plasmodium malariae TaxID=5858 RepID=A0A1A8VUG4_PLAMA|nr:adenylate kinase-like protein 2, putative [Plasmodium malariae]